MPDWGGIATNLIAAAIVIFVVDGVWRWLLGIVFGARPILKIVWRGPEPIHGDGSEWVHVDVENNGLRWARMIRAAEDVTIRGSIDGTDLQFVWATPLGVKETRHVYGRAPARFPLVIRDTTGQPPPPHYGWRRKPRTAYMADAVFLTQSGQLRRPAPGELSVGAHKVALVVTSKDGAATSLSCTLDIPAWPSRITLTPDG